VPHGRAGTTKIRHARKSNELGHSVPSGTKNRGRRGGLGESVTIDVRLDWMFTCCDCPGWGTNDVEEWRRHHSLRYEEAQAEQDVRESQDKTGEGEGS
jgi:hypothetical protein